jgi:hypothetical protein
MGTGTIGGAKSRLTCSLTALVNAGGPLAGRPFIHRLQSSNLGSAKKTVEPEPAEASGAENGAEEVLLMAIAGALSLAGANGRDELLIIIAGLTASMVDVTVTAANIGWVNV